MIDIKNLSVSYGSKEVLKNLEISFSDTKIHGILGINGAGKSTFFNALYGTKKVNAGTISINENFINKSDVAFLQTENYFYPLMKGKEYLQLVAPNKGFLVWNEIFQLPLNEFVENYSTGMKKKIAFLGLVLLNRKVYILDEPFNGVDLQSNEILLRIIESLKDKGKYVLISSHILSSLLQISDHIYRLKNGKFDPAINRSEFAQFESDFKKEISDEISSKLKNIKF